MDVGASGVGGERLLAGGEGRLEVRRRRCALDQASLENQDAAVALEAVEAGVAAGDGEGRSIVLAGLLEAGVGRGIVSGLNLPAAELEVRIARELLCLIKRGIGREGARGAFGRAFVILVVELDQALAIGRVEAGGGGPPQVVEGRVVQNRFRMREGPARSPIPLRPEAVTGQILCCWRR